MIDKLDNSSPDHFSIYIFKLILKLGDDLLDRRSATRRVFRKQSERTFSGHGSFPRTAQTATACSVAPSRDAATARRRGRLLVLHRAAAHQRVHHAVVLDAVRHVPAEGGGAPRVGPRLPRGQRRPFAQRARNMANASRVSATRSLAHSLGKRPFFISFRVATFPFLFYVFRHRRILTVRTCDDFYSIMAVLAREMLEFGLMEPNHLVQVIYRSALIRLQ